MLATLCLASVISCALILTAEVLIRECGYQFNRI